MPSRYYSAIAQDTTLASGITNVATSMTVSSLVGFPARSEEHTSELQSH